MGNNLSKILDMFNLTYNEEFLLEGDSVWKYRFTLKGLEFYDEHAGWCEVKDNTLEYMILGYCKVYVKWLPKRDDTYYIPDISSGEPRIITTTWRDTDLDNTRYVAHVVFKTKDGALACAEEILGFLAKR